MTNSISLVLDDESKRYLKELSEVKNKSKSKIVRESIKEKYIKKKMVENNYNLLIDLYNDEKITKDILYILLSDKDAESIVIGSKTGKEAEKSIKDSEN